MKLPIIRHKLSWLILALTLIALIKPYFHAGVPFTHDGENHLARFANYKIALKEGQFPPRFAPNLLNHYGYPVFNYNYPLLNILSVPFSVIGVSYELIFKLLMVSGVLLGAWGVWRWVTLCGYSRSGRVVAVLAYLLAPFMVNLVFVRGSIGELWALALFPWLLWLTKKIKKEEPVSWLWSVLLITSFLLSHNISVLFGGALWFLYTIKKFGKNKTLWKRWFGPVVLSVLLSLWFWLPALAEKQFVVVDDADLSSQFVHHFVEPLQLVTAPLQFGYSYAAPIDTLSFSIGLAGVVGLVVATLWLLKRKPSSVARETRWLWFFVLVCWALLFFQTRYSAWIWSVFPLVQFIQFPWRLTLFLSVLVLPLIASVITLSRPLKLVMWLCLLFEFIAVWRLQPVSYFHKSTLEYDLFPQTTSTLNENMVKGFTYLGIGDWQPAPKALTGIIQATVQAWTGSSRRYQLTVQQDTLVVEPTMFFPGWETTVNGEKIAYAEVKDTEGRLGFRLPAGQYEVVTRFTQHTWPRMVGNSVGVVAFGIWGWLLWREKRHFFGRSSR